MFLTINLVETRVIPRDDDITLSLHTLKNRKKCRVIREVTLYCLKKTDMSP